MGIFHLSLPHCLYLLCFPGGAVGKNLPAKAGNVRETGSIPGSGSSPRVVSGNPLQYSCLGHPMERGAFVYEVTKSQMQLDMHPYPLYIHLRLLFCFKGCLEAEKKITSSKIKILFFSLPPLKCFSYFLFFSASLLSSQFLMLK